LSDLRFLDRGVEKTITKGTIISINTKSQSENRVWYIKSGKLLYEIIKDERATSFTCLPGDLAGIINVAGPDDKALSLSTKFTALEDTDLYGWNKDEFFRALGMFQDFAVLVLKRLSVILRLVNHLTISQETAELTLSETPTKPVPSKSQTELTLSKSLTESAPPESQTEPAPSQTPTEEMEMELMEFAFGEINDSSKSIFAKVGISFNDQEIIFPAGSNGTELYIILSGKVEIFNPPESILDVLKAGEIFGEMSHFDNSKRSASARSKGVTKLLVFSKENFSLIFQLHPKWTIKLVEGLAERIHNTITQL